MSSVIVGLCGLLCLLVLFKYANQHYASKEIHDSPSSTECDTNFKDQNHPVTVIIPALNEDDVLTHTLDNLFTSCTLPTRTAPTVIIVLAGSNSSDTTSIKRLKSRYPTLHFEFTSGPPSRGGQQNHGAHLAQSHILLFLHADTLLPISWDTTILSTLTHPHKPPSIGAFSLSLPEPISPSLRIMLYGANIRARHLNLPYGDQAYFLLRSTFESVGGFPNVPIMEDVSLLRRIKQYHHTQRSPKGGPALLVVNEKVQTSPRRWVTNGMLWNTLLNQLLMSAWLCGVSPRTIYVWYYGRTPEDMAHSVLKAEVNVDK